ncbi:hypothetical protein [Jiulongibacter sediminis]|uniref:hypothetical protein n=1 Tax=Jiulongibacter sediminis TaxID=1605367 RepID=UPI0026EFB753|nr:hypothetical protein [Jiulongibacter sediminis]
MKKTIIMSLISSVIIAAGVFSCNLNDEILPVIESPEYSIIDGDTVKIRVDEELPESIADHIPFSYGIVVGDTIASYNLPRISSTAGKPDLSRLSDRKMDVENPFRVVAFGGSLTAGVRDFGYFNEGMETSYPSLVAKQMGVNFRNPLFAVEDFNGYGRVAATGFNPTNGPVKKYLSIKNNTAVKRVAGSEVVESLERVNFDNLAIPFLKTYTKFPINYDGKPYSPNTDLNKPEVFNYSYSRFRQILYNRWESLYNQKTDFFILEEGLENFTSLHYLNHWPTSKEILDKDDYIDLIQVKPGEDNTNKYRPWYFQGGISPAFVFALEAYMRGEKGVILNTPDPADLPFYNSIPLEEADKLYAEANLSSLFNYSVRDYSYSILPTSTSDSLLSPNIALKIKPGISKNEVKIQGYNRNLELLEMLNYEKEVIARKLNYPLVDLHSLYKKIRNGEFITDDGVLVEDSFPKGNFYSADGIYPSAFGQAVIANEVIKAINSHYKTTIPLLQTREFLTNK